MKIFNSDLELTIRILLLLETIGADLNSSMVENLDIIALYGLDYDISEENLHGDNSLGLAEISSRHDLVAAALKRLVLKRLATIKSTNNGFFYSISSNGHACCSNMQSDYSREYRKMVILAKEFCSHKTEKEIQQFVLTKKLGSENNG